MNSIKIIKKITKKIYSIELWFQISSSTKIIYLIAFKCLSSYKDKGVNLNLVFITGKKKNVSWRGNKKKKHWLFFLNYWTDSFLTVE